MSIGNVGDVGSADNVENWGIIGNSGKFGNASTLLHTLLPPGTPSPFVFRAIPVQQ